MTMLLSHVLARSRRRQKASKGVHATHATTCAHLVTQTVDSSSGREALTRLLCRVH